MNTNQRRAEQLGMPFGTACGKLRKKILFALLKKYNENFCYRCSKIIDKIEELSIEHKKQWLDISVDLFWDLDNIAFSHLTCNCGAPKSDSYRKHLSDAKIGENNHNAKLSDKEVDEIRRRSSLGETCRKIAKDFNISHVHVLDIKNGHDRQKKTV